MKYAATLLVLLTFFLLPAAAQEHHIKTSELPEAVVKSFNTNYPNATITGTSIEKEQGVTYYEIESLDGSVRRDLLYTADGRTTEVEERIPVSSLPAAVQKTLQSRFKGHTILRAERTTRDSATTFEVLLSTRAARSEVVLNPSGTIIRTESLKPVPKRGKKETESDEDND